MSSLSAIVVTRAGDFPRFALQCLEANPIPANLILPTLYKCMNLERDGRSLPGQFWIIIYDQQQVLFIVSCTNGYMGTYPVFFFTPIPYASLHPAVITPALQLIAVKLRDTLSTRRRVYSIFAPEIVSRLFADLWSQLTGIRVEQDPYYHAKISYLTRETFKDRRMPLLPEGQLRRGLPADINSIADLCYRFARDSPPFTLSRDEARREAKSLVESGSVWVYSVIYSGRPEIASIVATTRNTQTTATITKACLITVSTFYGFYSYKFAKVFTHPDFRGQGCAEILVRHVCKELLMGSTRYIVLYVGIENPAANVYEKVGFVGVGRGAQHYVQGVDPWLELGFDRSYVQMGQW